MPCADRERCRHRKAALHRRAIGFVDQSALANSADVKNASDQLQKFQAAQQPIYAARFKNANNDVAKQQVMADYNKAIQDEQNKLLKPLIDQTKSATASVARSKNLLLVVDRADVVYGGTDITQDVQNALNKIERGSRFARVRDPSSSRTCAAVRMSTCTRIRCAASLTCGSTT